MRREVIERKLNAGVRLHAVFDNVDSTNTYLKNLCRTQRTAEPTLVLAQSQSGGRGRLGRTFVSPHGGLYMSMAFDAAQMAESALLITAAAAVAVCRVLDLYTKEKAQIKWVNDIYLGGKKICGILTEAVTDSRLGQIQNIIVGIGINLSGFDAFDAQLQEMITTLDKHTDKELCRETLAAQIANALCEVAANLTDVKIMEEYRKRSFVLGKAVYVLKNDEKREAIVTDITPDGGLCVRYADMSETVLRSAEISVRTI